MEVARVLREKIYINPAKLKLLECLGFSKDDIQWFTVKEEESHIHVVPLWTLASFKRLKHVANRYTVRNTSIRFDCQRKTKEVIILLADFVRG